MTLPSVWMGNPLVCNCWDGLAALVEAELFLRWAPLPQTAAAAAPAHETGQTQSLRSYPDPPLSAFLMIGSLLIGAERIIQRTGRSLPRHCTREQLDRQLELFRRYLGLGARFAAAVRVWLQCERASGE